MTQDVWEWFRPHWISYGESRILDLTQNPVDLFGFQDFRIGGIAMFPLDFIMYYGMVLVFNQENQALYARETPNNQEHVGY